MAQQKSWWPPRPGTTAASDPTGCTPWVFFHLARATAEAVAPDRTHLRPAQANANFNRS
jgi:hypothetical protein